MSSIYIVQGKPSVSTNMLAARLKQSGRYRYEILEKTPAKCAIQFYELIEDWTEDGRQVKKWVKPGPPEVYTLELAKTAGLTKNPVWQSHSMNMNFNRCMSNGIKTYAPDLLSGVPIYTPDELDPSMRLKVTADGDVVPDAEYTVNPTPQPSTPSGASADQVAEIEELIAKTGTDRSTFLGFFKADSVSAFSAKDATKAVSLLQEKLRSSPKN